MVNTSKDAAMEEREEFMVSPIDDDESQLKWKKTLREAYITVVRSQKSNAYRHHVWMEHFAGKGGDHLDHAAFLTLWLSRYVLPSKSYQNVQQALIPVAIYLSQGIPIALVLASNYRDMNLLKKLIIPEQSSNSRWIEDESNPIIRAPLHFVQLWAWERFPNLQPKASIVNSGEPRVARWQKNSITHIEYQCNLDSIKMCLVVWIMLGEIMTDRLKMLNSMYLPGYSESDVSKRYLEWWNNQNVGNIQDCEMRVVESSSDDDNLPISEFSRRRKLKKKEITVVTAESLRLPMIKSEESDEDDPSVDKEMVSLESKYNNDKGGCKLNLPDSIELASGGPNANQSDGRYAKFSSSTPAKMHLQMSEDSVEAPKVNTNGINRTEGMDMGNMNTHEKGSSRFELKDIPKLEMRLRNLESIIARKVPRVRTK
ncbi:hypothetical protein K7X08_012507 [Anisodus acutangulus]|uniref:Aminotransferase-like plant mobile domain-containing protein n=1 Tax=Anisodus acutangulus TaxID=402998 RepID=A0A9Q1QZ56_9SOLA|nr:hypothetical protein K7X08_012507 [Anisodus acutangulus]